MFFFASGLSYKTFILFFHISSFCFFAEDEFPQAVFVWGGGPKSCNEDRADSHAFWLHLIPMKVRANNNLCCRMRISTAILLLNLGGGGGTDPKKETQRH